jgi:hypothetical protein
MTVVYITYQLRRPSRDGDPGAVAEGWYKADGDYTQMTDRDGIPLAGEKNRKKLRPGEMHREVASRLLREKASRFAGSQSFNRPLRYPTVRF